MGFNSAFKGLIQEKALIQNSDKFPNDVLPFFKNNIRLTNQISVIILLNFDMILI